jgi:hypothetical protein
MFVRVALFLGDPGGYRSPDEGAKEADCAAGDPRE